MHNQSGVMSINAYYPKFHMFQCRLEKCLDGRIMNQEFLVSVVIRFYYFQYAMYLNPMDIVQVLP